VVDGADEPTNVQVLILGVGTVFGTLGVVLAAMLLYSLFSGTSDLSAKDTMMWLTLYGFIGAVLAAMICVVVALPLLILFRLLFSQLRKKGFGTRRSAMISAGCLSLLGTVSVILVAVANKATFLPVAAWPSVLLPALLTLLLARRMFSDDREITSK
jgi:hypothetical protein